MREYGINTTKAKWMLFLYPLEDVIHFCLVSNVKKYIAEHKPKGIPGYSRDGSKTSEGYLIPKSEPFVTTMEIDPKYCSKYDRKAWKDFTQRQSGLDTGEGIMLNILNDHLFWKGCEAWKLNEKKERMENKYNFIGISKKNGNLVKVWGQTCIFASGNLFIKKLQGDHKVHLTSSGKERITEIPNRHTWKSKRGDA